MAYTAAIGEKGATVKQVRKMEQLLDAKIGSGGGTLEDAPSDGQTYVRVNGEWHLVSNAALKNYQSAYLYAVEGGFTGTEEEFSALLLSWLTDAPHDGNVYVRVNGTWAVVLNATVTSGAAE